MGRRRISHDFCYFRFRNEVHHPVLRSHLVMATHELQKSPEYFIFRKHYARLCDAIQDPPSLAAELYFRGILPRRVLERTSLLSLTRLEKNSRLLSHVETQILTNSQAFRVFISALNKDITIQSLVESIRSKCRTVFESTSSPFPNCFWYNHLIVPYFF